ncbi:MAG: DNA polymerase III subunit beta [Oscillospiraceae bacterium]|nr:DNA polymerase III subunit beta [Oscillospiraceae bacterium]
MKFSCEKSLLQPAINVASRATTPKSSIPALEGVLLEADSELRLTGYNLETGIRTVVPAQVKETGSLVISAKKLGDIVKNLPDDMVTLTADGLSVHIECGDVHYNIQGIDPEEFPELPTVEPQNALILSQDILADMINRTLFAVSNNEGRPILTGSLFEVVGDILTVVSVDGQRLALRREKLEEGPGKDFSFVVPGPALNEVRGICSEVGENVEITTGARHIMFRTGSTLMVTRRLEGEFLNYRQSISWKSTISFTADIRSMITSINRVSLILQENVKNPLRCIVGDNILYFSSLTPTGDASDRCPIAGNGEDLHIGFNHRFMLDALKAVPTDTAKFLMGSPSTPCIIVPEDQAEGEEEYLFMVLPVRMSANWDKR